LTLGLLEAGAQVLAVEIDHKLAAALPTTVAARAEAHAAHLTVIAMDAMKVTPGDLPAGAVPSRLVANLPYNVAVPVILHVFATFPTIESVLVMVQAEVARRIVAGPGSRV